VERFTQARYDYDAEYHPERLPAYTQEITNSANHQ